MPLGSNKIALNKNKSIGGSGYANVTLVVDTVETLTNSHTVEYAVTSNIPDITLKYKIETNLTGLDFQNGSVDGTVSIDGTGAGTFEVQLLDGYFTGPADPQFKTNITRDSGVIVVEGNVHLIEAVEPLQIQGGTNNQANIDGNIYQVVNLTESMSSAVDQSISMNIVDLGDYSSYSGAPLEMQVLIAGGGGGTDSANTSLSTFTVPDGSGGTYTFEPWKWMGLAGGAGGESLQFTVPFANLAVTSYAGTIGKGGAIGINGTGGNTTFLGETVTGGVGVPREGYLDTNPDQDYVGGSGATAVASTAPRKRGGHGASGSAAGLIKNFLVQPYPYDDIRKWRPGVGGTGNSTSRGDMYLDPYEPRQGSSGGAGQPSDTGYTMRYWWKNLTEFETNNVSAAVGMGGNGSAWEGDPGNGYEFWSQSTGDNPKTGNNTPAGESSPYHAQGGSGVTTLGEPIDFNANITVTPSIGNSGTIQVRYPYFSPTRTITS